MYRQKSCYYLAAMLLSLSMPLKAELLQSSSITAINTQSNSNSSAASNLRDDDHSTRWLSSSYSHINDINFQFNSTSDGFCYDEANFVNFDKEDRSVKQFMLLSSNNEELSGDTSTNAIDWRPIVANKNPDGLLNYLSWAQGARLVTASSEYNTTNFAAKNIYDGNDFSKWFSKSYQNYNIFEYNFDTDWDGNTGNGIPIEEIEITNYGNIRSIKELQIEVTTDGTNWFKLEVPGTAANDSEFVYSRSQDGGVLGAIDNQNNTTNNAAANINDGSNVTRWLSKNTQGNNTIEFTFDPNNNGLTGANGDADDLFNIDKLHLENYGTDRSIKEFQVEVKTLFNPNWSKITAPDAEIGKAGYDFLMSHHGAEMVTIGSEYDSTYGGADNLHDGDNMTHWLSKNKQSNNDFEFKFDVNEDGTKDANDYFSINSIFLQNYGNDTRSIKEFQVSVKTASNSSWQKIKVPGAMIGVNNYNFLLKDQGGTLTAINSELNNTTWAAENIHDGSQMTYWLSKNTQINNTLEFQFDVDDDGNTATSNDLFSIESIYLQNYGNDDRSIKEFQVAVKTLTNSTWKKIKVPGATIGIPDHNFLLNENGGVLTAVNSELNNTSWAAKNIHDGSQVNQWLSLGKQLSNTLDFQFDVNEDGTAGTSDDLFTMEKFYLQNYGNDGRSIKFFQIEVKTSNNTNWTKLIVPGSGANEPNYNFSLAQQGGKLTFIDSESNSSSLGAKNLHDGSPISQWLSKSNQLINMLEFAFDTDNNGSTGDSINLDTITLINYGNDDRSIRTFEIDIQILGGEWQSANSLEGETTFTASKNNNAQSWSLTPQTNVTATRIRTLTNYGDPTYIGASEISFSGYSVGPSNTFTAAMNKNGETFTLDSPVVDVTDVRLRTINNYGDTSYVGATEFKVLGKSVIETSTFVAEMNSNGETYILDSNDIPKDVTDVKLITISNHGDPDYIGAAEFKVFGPSTTKTKTFVAAMHDDGETFILDNEDIPVDVTDVKFTTISNHGDPSFTGARAFKVFGNSITKTKTFVAAMHSDGESFVLNSNDVPVGVTDVKLTTISNHGNNNNIGAAEFEVIGHSVTPSHTFVLPIEAEPYRIILDSEDTVTGVTGARIITINSHGDSNYIGASEFKLLGTAIGPSYVFEAAMDSSIQNFTFTPRNSKLLRFHTINNYGDPAYTSASELTLNSAVCPAGQWRLDEQSWNGTPGEVIDSSGGNHLGTVLGIDSGLADPNTANIAPAITGNPGTCHYGEFDGVDDYIEISDSDDLDNTDKITISAWFNAKSFTQTNGTNARGIFSKRKSITNNISYGAFFWNDRGSKLYIDIDTQNNRFASNTSFNVDTWYHIAIVFDGTKIVSERVSLYVNGVLDGTFAESSNSIPDTESNFYIGNLYTGLDELKVFDGAIDEVNVISKALSATEVLELKNATQPCEIPPVFIDINTSGTNGSSCAAQPYIIRACADAACNSLLTNYSGNIDINVSSSHGDWNINNANGTLIDSIKDDGSASYTFNPELDNGSVILDLFNSHAETVTITVNDKVAPASATSNSITFSDNAFVIDHGDNLHIAGRDQAMSVSLYTKDSGVCEINPLYSGNKDIQVWLDRDLADPSGAAPSINDITLPNTSSTAFNLAFTNGTASFNLASTDVGKYNLNIIDKSLSFSDQNISGTTSIVTRPFGFDVNVVDNDVSAQINGKAENANSDIFMTAGSNFIVNVRAVAWQATDDIDNNGIPDGHNDNIPSNNADLSDNNEVTSFGAEKNNQSEFVDINAYEFLPNLNTLTNVLEDGSLHCNSCTISSYSLGVGSSDSVYYNEVGIIEVTTTLADSSYLGAENVIGASGFVGRFIPHHFVLNKEFDGELSEHNGFVYTGQMKTPLSTKGAISYASMRQPEFTITAKSALNTTTKNYTGSFMKLLNTSINRISPESDSAIITSELVADLQPVNLEESEGVITYTYNEEDNFVYTRNTAAVIDKFPANIDLVISSVIDEDGVVANNANGTTNENGTENDVLTMSPLRPSDGLDIYFGRWYIANTYGPETSPLTVKMEIQYWNGKRFVANPLEDNENVVATDLSVTNIDLSPGITAPAGNGLFSNGINHDIVLSVPSDDSSNDIYKGNVKIEYNAPPWLLYDWNNTDTLLDGPYTDMPSSTATFGIFRGNDRIISWREVLNN